MLTITQLLEVTSPPLKFNGDRSRFNYKKLILPAVGLVGAGLAGGLYYNHKNDITSQQYDVNRVQHASDARHSAEQEMENMKRYGASSDEIAVQQNKIDVLKNQENQEKEHFSSIHGDGSKMFPEVYTTPGFASDLNS